MKKRKEVEDEDEEKDFDHEQATLLLELAKDIKKQGYAPMSKLVKSLVEEAYASEDDESFTGEFIYKMIDIWLACKFKKA